MCPQPKAKSSVLPRAASIVPQKASTKPVVKSADLDVTTPEATPNVGQIGLANVKKRRSVVGLDL